MNISSLSLIADYTPQLCMGALTTLYTWLLSAVLGVSLGCMIGIACCNRLRLPIISPMLDYLTFILRGIPFYVQLLITYFVLPDVLGINLSPFTAGTLSLGLCSSAYSSQIIRGGINAISKGQWEAAFVLGYSPLQTMRFIIIPQILYIITPALGGELDQLLKTTSILSAIGFLELTRVGMNIIAREMAPITVYLTIAAIYLSLSTLISLVTKKIETISFYER